MVTTINGKYRHINEIVTYVYVLPALKKKNEILTIICSVNVHLTFTFKTFLK